MSEENKVVRDTLRVITIVIILLILTYFVCNK